MGQNCSTSRKNNQPIVGQTEAIQTKASRLSAAQRKCKQKENDRALRSSVEIDDQDAIAWCNLGAMRGDSAGQMIVAGQQYTDQQCCIKALELNNKYAIAWHNLDTVGGGSVGGQQYTQQQCYNRRDELETAA